MKISLIVVGKTPTGDLQASMINYTEKLSHYTNFEICPVSEEKLALALAKYDRVILLDEHGREYSSVEFAGFIEKQLNASLRRIAFVIGGPFGFNPAVRALADLEIALSRMTFPHDLVRVIFLEQLYRALSIIRHEKYHHE